jgi:hypothetical protein
VRRSARRAAAAILAAIALVAGAAACGGSAPARVSKSDADAISQALSNQSRPVSTLGCFNVRRGVRPDTLRAYALLLRVARKNPDALLQSQDFNDLHPPIREYVGDWAGLIGNCIAHAPSVGPGWRALEARLEHTVATMARPG